MLGGGDLCPLTRRGKVEADCGAVVFAVPNLLA